MREVVEVELEEKGFAGRLSERGAWLDCSIVILLDVCLFGLMQLCCRLFALLVVLRIS